MSVNILCSLESWGSVEEISRGQERSLWLLDCYMGLVYGAGV
jgi:hypothetical protein